jgi:hypothetical protein
MKQAFVITEMAAVLAIATRNYMNGGYSNLMMAIPNAVIEWAEEYRISMGIEWQDDAGCREIELNIAHVKAQLTLAFQFPLNFIK